MFVYLKWSKTQIIHNSNRNFLTVGALSGAAEEKQSRSEDRRRCSPAQTTPRGDGCPVALLGAGELIAEFWGAAEETAAY